MLRIIQVVLLGLASCTSVHRLQVSEIPPEGLPQPGEVKVDFVAQDVGGRRTTFGGTVAKLVVHHVEKSYDFPAPVRVYVEGSELVIVRPENSIRIHLSKVEAVDVVLADDGSNVSIAVAVVAGILLPALLAVSVAQGLQH